MMIDDAALNALEAKARAVVNLDGYDRWLAQHNAVLGPRVADDYSLNEVVAARPRMHRNDVDRRDDWACRSTYIAALNPVVALALITRIRELEAALAQSNDLVASWAYAAQKQQFPSIIDPDRRAIIDAVEDWVNRACGGDATVDDIAAATLQAAINAGWLMEPEAARIGKEAADAN